MQNVYVPIASLLFAPLFRFRKSSFLKLVTLPDHFNFLSPFLHQFSNLASNVLIMWERKQQFYYCSVSYYKWGQSLLSSELTNVTQQISTLHELERFTVPVRLLQLQI